jgi:hypothetical protein
MSNPIVGDEVRSDWPTSPDQRRELLFEAFGMHLCRARNRAAASMRQTIEGDSKYPVPVYERMIVRLRMLPREVRADIASAILLFVDDAISDVLAALGSTGDSNQLGDTCLNYRITAEVKDRETQEQLEEFTLNRGPTLGALWKQYDKWLARYAPSELRARSVPGSQ